jgi:predicted transcriptional regulator of viral defense system
MRRTDALDALLEAANEQGGYVNGAQARRLDVTDGDIKRLVHSGDLQPVRRGVYRMRHAQTRFEDDLAAWLHLQRDTLPWEQREEPRAVLSHQSAAAFHDLGTIVPTKPTFTAVRGGITEAEGLVLHRMRLPREDWAWTRDGTISLPVTTPARTIVDLVLSHEELSYIERAIREAISKGQTTVDELLETATRRKTNSLSIQTQVAKLLEVVA